MTQTLEALKETIAAKLHADIRAALPMQAPDRRQPGIAAMDAGNMVAAALDAIAASEAFVLVDTATRTSASDAWPGEAGVPGTPGHALDDLKRRASRQLLEDVGATLLAPSTESGWTDVSEEDARAMVKTLFAAIGADERLVLIDVRTGVSAV